MESNKVPLREGIYYNAAFSCLESYVGNIHLTPNEKKILEIILDNRGRKETIIDEIWHQQGIVVSESSYHQLVKMLRRKFVAAGLSSSCLKTISRYGIVFINEPIIPSISMIGATPCPRLPDAIRELLPDRTTEVINQHSGVFGFLWPRLHAPSTLYFAIFAVIFISLSIVTLLSNSSSSGYFQRVKVLNHVIYYAAPTAQVSEVLWQRIEQHVLPMTREVYVASNGPKMWVAYCEKSIYKDNVPCAYEHFSVY